MIDALAARDAAGLRQLLITHLHHKRDVVLEMMRAGTLKMPSKA
jgi:DNA-binding GntR family transcriptional regulator